MRVTSKGRVTIRKDIRDRLGIGPGPEVDFIATDDGVRVVAVNQNVSPEESERKIPGSHASDGRHARSPRDDHGRMHGMAEGTS